MVTANAALLRDKSWANPYEPSPKLVLLASYPGEIALDYQETLFNKETEIVTCRNFLPHEPDRVLRLLAAGMLDVDAAGGRSGSPPRGPGCVSPAARGTTATRHLCH